MSPLETPFLTYRADCGFAQKVAWRFEELGFCQGDTAL
jgi:hypothetical protein